MADVCDLDCFNCAYPDCIRANPPGIGMEERVKARKEKSAYRYTKSFRERNTKQYARAGALFRQYRERRGMTREEVARVAECHINTVYAIETGELRMTENMEERFETAMPGIGAWMLGNGE